MHELAVTQGILDIALGSLEEAGGHRVGRIDLAIGEMTGVVEECVRFYFGVISRGTPAEDAELSVRVVPTSARCQSCGETFLVRECGWVCPRCASACSDLTGGKELIVESIEVRDGSQGTQRHP